MQLTEIAFVLALTFTIVTSSVYEILPEDLFPVSNSVPEDSYLDQLKNEFGQIKLVKNGIISDLKGLEQGIRDINEVQMEQFRDLNDWSIVRNEMFDRNKVLAKRINDSLSANKKRVDTLDLQLARVKPNQEESFIIQELKYECWSIRFFLEKANKRIRYLLSIAAFTKRVKHDV